LTSFLEPGAFVRNPSAPDWGIGQVQSVIGNRITVNFEHSGKRVVNADRVSLDLVLPTDTAWQDRQP
jgi:transcription elongation factor GreA-like protein